MPKIVNSWNDWDLLKYVIVGKADYSMIPPEEPATSEGAGGLRNVRPVGTRPTETVEKANEQLDGYAKILRTTASRSTGPPPCSGTSRFDPGLPDRFRHDGDASSRHPADHRQ